MKQRRSKILIVDDDVRNLKVLEAMIKSSELEIFTAMSGAEALEQAVEKRPDAILLDIMMPDLSGIEVCRTLKQDPDLCRIPIVFVTALNDVTNQAEAVEAGGIGFITKPVIKVLVLANVKNALRMKQLSDEVEDLMQQRKNLTTMLVHDINNLLQVNLGYAKLILLNENIGREIHELAAGIHESAANIKAMTSSLLDIEKLESGTLPIRIEKVAAGALAVQRAALLLQQTESSHFTYQPPEHNGQPFILADSYLLTRIVDNLLFNASKFCSEGGAIQIHFRTESPRWILSITNDGHPIPSNYHERIFEKFGQVESQPQSVSHKGVGLGLAFCRMAVEAMGGSISVTSPLVNRHDGVCFSVHLPMAPE